MHPTPTMSEDTLGVVILGVLSVLSLSYVSIKVLHYRLYLGVL